MSKQQWETFCACDHMYSVETSQLKGRRGTVSQERRRVIRRKLIQSGTATWPADASDRADVPDPTRPVHDRFPCWR